MRERLGILLEELRTNLGLLYQSRLQGVYLFRSYARGDEQPQSDFDLLIVLDEIPAYAAELDRTSVLISTLSIKYGVSVSRVFVSEHDWKHGEGPFLDSTREKAIPA